jgi:lipoprotein-anchoring transpeptidase ErfK/SrfK
MRRLYSALPILVAFLLAATAAWAGEVEISVNKLSQKMTVSVDGERQFVWPVSTGRAGYDTPAGSYQPFRMEKEHFSKEWYNAPMPYAMFFTAGGHAIHGTSHIKSLGTRASHGCVRLAPENAATLFDLVQAAGMINTTIVITGNFFDSGLYAPDAPGILMRKGK